MNTEDKEIFEDIYIELDDFYYTVGGDVPFYEVKDRLVQIVLNKLALSKEEAYVFVCMWFDNRH